MDFNTTWNDGSIIMEKIDEELKQEINQMTHEEMCRVWRFGSNDNQLLRGEPGEYFKERLFNHFGGFTPEISKRIGW